MKSKGARGRPQKNLHDDTISQSNSFNQKLDINCPMIPETNGINNSRMTPGHHRLSRNIKIVDKINENLSNDELNNDEEEVDDGYIQKRTRRRRGGTRGRRPGKTSTHTVDSNYVPRISELNMNKKNCQSTNKKSNDNDDDNNVTCGKCYEIMLQNQWIKHNLNKHNNMGWIDGETIPNYESDEKLWRSILSIAHKRRKGSLICEKCCTTKRSVIGFISHYQFCGKTDEERQAMKWTCPQCHGIFMPSSQDAHERMHRDMHRQNEKLMAQMLENNDDGDGKGKRKAAEKAATKISELTALVKGDDETSCVKKIKMCTNIRDLIERSSKSNSIPSVWKGAWMRSIAANEVAHCRQPGCTFNTTILNEIYEHYGKCKYAPMSIFMCKLCKTTTETMENIKAHIKDNHGGKINIEDDSDFCISESSDDSDIEDPQIELPVRNNKKSSVSTLSLCDKAPKYEDRAAFLRNEKYYSDGSSIMTFVPALKWTLKFELKNYHLLLYENLKPNNFILLSNDDANEYLPKLTVSMRAKHKKNSLLGIDNGTINNNNDEWKIWNRFESSVVDGFPTIFVGGPIWSMAWLPIPTILYSNNVNQYIAIGTHINMNDNFANGKSYKFKNIIQLWNMGHLEHTMSYIPQVPQLSYAIAHNNGTIWCMEWCPSGTYDNSYVINNNHDKQNSSRRLGLLAVASSDGCVHIYSMPFPHQLNFINTDNNNLPIYKTHPVITLQFNQLLQQNNDNINWQCLTLNWSKVHEHDTIAAGFTNGYVALWNIKTKSPLLLTKNDDTLIITSYRQFYAHSQSVTGITIIPLKGKRYLATVSTDRYAKFWDLEDVSNCINATKKGITVNSTWLTHWPNILSSYDDALGMGHTVTYMISLRESYNKSSPLLPTNSPAYGLASSDYANGICHGTSAGELVAIFPYQMLHFRDLDKLHKKRWLVSSIDVYDFETIESDNNKGQTEIDVKQSNLKERIYMPATYEECNQRFGIIFQDDVNNVKANITKKSQRKHSLNSEMMKIIPIEQYNFTSINRITWNPNAWSYLWVGVGYQNGFVRILHFNSMSMQNAILNLLPKHKKLILNKENDIASTNVT